MTTIAKRLTYRRCRNPAIGGNPERLLPEVGIDCLAERDLLLVFKKNAEKKMRVVPEVEGMTDP
jgi:hypothetical protein